MLPTSRCIGGITRPKDLRFISRSTGGHLDRLKVEQSLLPETDTPSSSKRVHGSSRDARDLTDPLDIAPDNAARVDTSLVTQSIAHSSFTSPQIRGFHTSSSVPYESTSYAITDDVPDFFVKYKHQRSDSEAHGHKQEDLGLMPSLTHSILSGDVVATTRPLHGKIPFEHRNVAGHVVHPSGFVVPGPGHKSTSDVARYKERERREDVDRAMQTAAVARRVLESDFEHVNATTLPYLQKVPLEVRESDGTVKHASGFVPPTPVHEFRHIADYRALRDYKVSSTRRKARQPSPPRGVLRAMHTAQASQGSGDS